MSGIEPVAVSHPQDAPEIVELVEALPDGDDAPEIVELVEALLDGDFQCGLPMKGGARYPAAQHEQY